MRYTKWAGRGGGIGPSLRKRPENTHPWSAANQEEGIASPPFTQQRAEVYSPPQHAGLPAGTANNKSNGPLSGGGAGRAFRKRGGMNVGTTTAVMNE